jgi:hypothetical protein
MRTIAVLSRRDDGAQATIGVVGRSRACCPQRKEPSMLANLLCPPRRTLIAAAASLCLTSTAFAGAHVDSGGKPKALPTPSEFYEHTGFDGREAQLGAAVVEAIRKAGPENGEGLNFSPAQTEMLGLAVAKAIKTISNDTPYQHEMNDALVKAQLTALQFAKDNNLLAQMVEHDVKTQAPMINRVAKMIQMGGSPELAIIALTERTACFYQLVQNYKREGMTIRWQTPYANVLASTRRLGQHDLTVEEIHQVYTVPLLSKQAQLMGMEAEISPVGADGWITMTIKQPAKVAAN